MNLKSLRWILVISFLLVQFIIIAWVIRGSQPKKEVKKLPEYVRWSEQVLEVAAHIPVQDGGRVKPLASYARFQMLRLYGALKMPIETGGEKIKITPTEWLLDVFFRPELANQLPVFRVDHADLLKAIGVETKKGRVRLSFYDIEPAYTEIGRRAEAAAKKSKETGEDSLTLVEKQVGELANQLTSYLSLRSTMTFANDGVELPAEIPLPKHLDAELASRISTWVAVYPEVVNSFIELRKNSQNENTEIPKHIEAILRTVNFYGQELGQPAAILPPYRDGEEEWKSPGGHLKEILEARQGDWAYVAAEMGLFENVAKEKPNSEAFVKALEEWKTFTTERATETDLKKSIEGEVSYYQANYFLYALVFFIIGFVICCLSWFGPKTRYGLITYWLSASMILVAFVILSWGIFQRSYLMGRPPVGNLYDTIPFITAGAVFLLGVGECLTRKRLLLAVGSFLGMIGIFMSFRYEFGRATDHMDPLVAVLNSNYWLATHVVIVTLGYAGGLVACFLSHIYVHLRLSGLVEENKRYQRFVTRAVYGVVCFTLFFSLVGTVLGGVWANDSWGRFWGWDPKENGALLIVLWTLIILHSRLAGWISDWGIHFASIFMGMVVAFSWWHVNMLEVGLHSYGFIKGGEVIWYFYLVELIALVIGGVAWLVSRYEKTSSKPLSPSEV